jgi:hypothetical protein
MDEHHVSGMHSSASMHHKRTWLAQSFGSHAYASAHPSLLRFEHAAVHGSPLVTGAGLGTSGGNGAVAGS